jgi:AGZA family xanthine/uracil permease-like MFS transporter
MTILFGVIARLPFALAAGLGINSFLAVSVVGQVTWQEAMGLVVINGVLIVLFGATGIRTAIFKAVPQALKAAITVGIGLFIAFIGFVDSGFVNRTPAGPGAARQRRIHHLGARRSSSCSASSSSRSSWPARCRAAS